MSSPVVQASPHTGTRPASEGAPAPEDSESRERIQWLIDHPGAPAVDHVHEVTTRAE